MKRRILAIASFTVTLAIILAMSGCRGLEINSEPAVAPSARLQEWSAAQAQGKLQPFPSEVTTKLQQVLDSSVGPRKSPGAGLYIATSNGIWMGTAGKSNVEAETAMKPTDRFRIGRLTQLFVAVVCLQLVEDGELNLNAAIANKLPSEVKTQFPDSRRITLRQLLNHTSGLPDLDTERFKQAIAARPAHQWTAKEVLNYVYTQEPANPKSIFSDSDTNYLLLELIIEKVTGTPLAKVIRSYILKPLGMNNTFMEMREPIPGGFAQGYQDLNDEGSPKNVTKPLLNTGLGLGSNGMVSDAPDLVRLFRALFIENSLLNASSLDEMLNHVGDRERRGYGLGIVYTPMAWGEAWGQTGKATGFMSTIAYLPVHDLIMVAWANEGDSKRSDPSEIVEKSLDAILGKPE